MGWLLRRSKQVVSGRQAGRQGIGGRRRRPRGPLRCCCARGTINLCRRPSLAGRVPKHDVIDGMPPAGCCCSLLLVAGWAAGWRKPALHDAVFQRAVDAHPSAARSHPSPPRCCPREGRETKSMKNAPAPNLRPKHWPRWRRWIREEHVREQREAWLGRGYKTVLIIH